MSALRFPQQYQFIFRFKLESDMVEDRLRRRFDYYLGKTEIVIYSVLAVLLAVTAFVTIATAGQILWIGLSHWTVAAQTLRVLNQLLIVLMLVEILHTVRISIRSHVLVTEPFLVVGLIASIRRILVITLEAATLTKEGAWATEGSSGIFHSSMIELGLLGLLILVLVVSITLLRRYAPASKDLSALWSPTLLPPRMRKDAPIYSQVRRFCPDRRQIGPYGVVGLTSRLHSLKFLVVPDLRLVTLSMARSGYANSSKALPVNDTGNQLFCTVAPSER